MYAGKYIWKSLAMEVVSINTVIYCFLSPVFVFWRHVQWPSNVYCSKKWQECAVQIWLAS